MAAEQPAEKAAPKRKAVPRKKAAPVKRVAKKRAAKKAAPKQTPEQDRVVTWANSHGAPVVMLTGWNPDEGVWEGPSPIKNMLDDIRQGSHITTAARRWNIPQIAQLMSKCHDFASEAPENREYIPIEARPFVDLQRAIDLAEAASEIELTGVVYKKAKTDAATAMLFLGRRFPSRWREQQQVLTTEDVDERDALVSQLVSDPNTAMQLAAIADRVEGQVAAADVE